MKLVSESGLSLIEMLILLLLAAVLAGVGIGQLGRIREQLQLEWACREFVTTLDGARRRAAAGNLRIAVAVAPGGTRYSIGPPGDPAPWRPVVGGARITASPRRSLRFYSRGAAVPAGSYLLERGRYRVKVIVSSAGRVRWQWQ